MHTYLPSHSNSVTTTGYICILINQTSYVKDHRDGLQDVFDRLCHHIDVVMSSGQVTSQNYPNDYPS